MEQAKEIELIRPGRQLAAASVRSEKESAIGHGSIMRLNSVSQSEGALPKFHPPSTERPARARGVSPERAWAGIAAACERSRVGAKGMAPLVIKAGMSNQAK